VCEALESDPQFRTRTLTPIKLQTDCPMPGVRLSDTAAERAEISAAEWLALKVGLALFNASFSVL
jgi:hypothetical protein